MIIVDVGAANVNLRKKPGKVYVLFEPDPEAYQALQYRYYHDPSVYVFQKGLWKKEQEVVLYLTRKRQCSSLFRPNLQLIRGLKDSKSNRDPNRFIVEYEMIIPVVRMESVLDQVVEDLLKKGYPKESIVIDNVKIDTQGSEYEILSGMGKYIDITKEIEIEVEFIEMYHGQKLFKDLDAYLSKNGFSFDSFLRLIQYKGTTVFGDARYTRR